MATILRVHAFVRIELSERGIIPDAMPAILNVLKATKKGGVPDITLELVHLRARRDDEASRRRGLVAEPAPGRYPCTQTPLSIPGIPFV